MISLYLDPYTLACPSSSEGQAAVKEYILNLIEWDELREADWAQLFLSMHALDILYETNLLPGWNDIDCIISDVGLFEFQPQDVYKLVTALLDRTDKFEDVLGLIDLKYDVQQDDFSDTLLSRPTPYRDHVAYLLVGMKLFCLVRGADPNHSILLSRNLAIAQAHLTAKILFCSSLDNGDSIVAPCTVHLDFPVCDNPDQLDVCLDYADIVNSSPNEVGLKRAIRAYALQHSITSGSNASKPSLAFCLGSDFLRSTQHLGFLTDRAKIETLIRAMTDTLFGLRRGDRRELREGRGAGNPQQVRGHDKAWRRDIDNEYRLHYWQHDTHVEFASVVGHNDFSIPY